MAKKSQKRPTTKRSSPAGKRDLVSRPKASAYAKLRLEDVSRKWTMSVGHRKPTSPARLNGRSAVAMAIKGTKGDALHEERVGSRLVFSGSERSRR
jgi:multidrug efflux pump subunit AcrB